WVFMRVAIIGAGPSGLACALALERRGVYPDIFECSSKVGYVVPRVEILLELFQRPQRRQLQHLFEHFGIRFKPLARVRRFVMSSLQQTVPISGELGYLVERSQSRDAVEVQLAEKLQSKITFDTMVDYRELVNKYDYVVVAEGNLMTARNLNVLACTMAARVKGAIILGRFDPESAMIYFNTGYARQGFGSLKPFSRERALLALNIPGVNHTELDSCWARFMEQENFRLEIIETFEIPYATGLTCRQQVGQILLTGSSGGLTDSFLGLGLMEGILSGALAGKAIAEGLNYEQLIGPLMMQVRRRFAFRKAINTLDNTGMVRLLKFIALPGVKQVIYNTNIDIINLLYPFVKKYNKKINRSYDR
ncbi:MAG: NAD(P)-binding protein, partial [Desulfotomaculaceae bacterium]|nr:NAD(P)-binding protein [Desulfotomaculaceae bacterium]